MDELLKQMLKAMQKLKAEQVYLYKHRRVQMIFQCNNMDEQFKNVGLIVKVT